MNTTNTKRVAIFQSLSHSSSTPNLCWSLCWAASNNPNLPRAKACILAGQTIPRSVLSRHFRIASVKASFTYFDLSPLGRFCRSQYTSSASVTVICGIRITEYTHDEDTIRHGEHVQSLQFVHRLGRYILAAYTTGAGSPILSIIFFILGSRD